MKAFLDGEHFHHRIRGVDAPCGSFSLRDGMRIRVDASESALMRRAVDNFRRFTRECLGVDLKQNAAEGDVILRIEGGGGESFAIETTADGITVTAPHERGLLHATHYLERCMADAGGPLLPLGKIRRSPALSPRFTEGVFVPGMQSPSNLGDFSDDYLGLMSHFGANALKFYIDLYEVWKSPTLPELNSLEFDRHAGALGALARRLAEFGIDLYLHLNTRPLDAAHLVFLRHPDVRGSRVEIFLEEFSGRDWHALCSSSVKTLRAYEEAVQSVFSAVPELAGAVVIVGGECFYHCFTRPPASGGRTDCPHCRGRDAHEEVARLVNTLHSAVKQSGAEKRLFAWPYSAFVWSRDDPMQQRWIRHLDPGVEVLANFDCYDEDVRGGAGVHLFDYNIKLIGPSSVFRAQAETCRRRGTAIHVKTETNTTPDTFFLPYLPVHFRWYERFKAIRESGARGFMGQWRFYGMNGSPPEELQYHSVWNPDRSAEELLETIVRRDFGVAPDRTDAVLEAWRGMSVAWEDFPYSALTCGEREGYMKGPWYLGPAHPLILTPGSRYNLGAKFFLLRGDLAEMMPEEERESLRGKPRYSEDTFLCLPFGIARYLEKTRRCRDQWEVALDALKAALGDPPAPRARMEIDVCETIGIHLHALANTVEFLHGREDLARKASTRNEFDRRLDALRAVVEREIANACRTLPILERDPRIGFGHIYGEVYDREMVAEKLDQCRYLLEKEIPRLRSFVHFHVWQVHP